MKCAQAGRRTMRVTARATSAKPAPSIRCPRSIFAPKSCRAGLNSNAPWRTYKPCDSSQVRRGCRVDSDAGQHAGELLHVLLAVAAVDAEGVPLHQLARVVLVDVADGILGVVEVLEHGRVLECREYQIAKTPERMRADRALLVISEQPALIGLVLVHAEMVEPEPHHLLAQLRRRIQRPQQLQTHRPIGEAVAFFIQRLAG